MASSRRKQDEKHLKILRELGSQVPNRTCFDCHQRGTTYINMTVGSFVCTSCSGILRGLNPPHRVKSISMASFTPEEIEQIKTKGNQYCQAVWLGLYDAKANPFPDTKDEHKIRDFMITKYEKKRFYIDPVVALKNMPPQTSSATSSNASTPNGETTKTGPTSTTSVSRPNVSSSQSSGSVGGVLPSANSGSKNPTPKSSASLDLLADLGNQSKGAVNSNDPFASPTSTQAPSTLSQPSFANFENANIFTNTAKILSEQILSSSYQPPQSRPSTPPPPPLAPPPRSCPSTRSPSPSQSPFRFSHWESFDLEDTSAALPLIPMAESSPYSVGVDASGRPIYKGKSNPTMIYAAGVSAQFVCPTNNSVAACVREENKLLTSSLSHSSSSSKSTPIDSRVSMSYPSKYESVANEEGLDSSSSLLSRKERDYVSKSTRETKSYLESSLTKGCPQNASKKYAQNSSADDKFSYSSLNKESSHSRMATQVTEYREPVLHTSGSFSHLNAKSNEISSKCFAAFLSSTSKLSGRSYQNFGSGHDRKISVVSLEADDASQDLEVEIGQVALDFDTLKVESQPRSIKSNVIESLDEVSCSVTPVGSVVEMKTNPFLSSDDIVPAPVDDNSVFDNVPFFNRRRPEASKPICINNCIGVSSNISSSCPSAYPLHASSYTNPFVLVSQLASTTRPYQLPVSSSSNNNLCQSYGQYSSSSVDVFAHETMQNNLQSSHPNLYNSMTPANYILAGTTSSNKSTPSGPPPPFSNSPLTPMTPGSSSSSSNPNSASQTSQASSQPAQDRYAALKDLDEEFKTQKESETISSNGGNGWSIPNGSHQNSANVFNGGGTVFGSPNTSNGVFSSGLVNGGSTGNISGGAFGTPPTNGGSTWANFSGANPFSGSCNGTGSPWVNGGNTFGSPSQNQQGFGSVVQPNPFGTAPDPNFNQFGSGAPINGASPNNSAWANFNQQPQNTKMHWMASNGPANPFMATPQMPSSGTSYNPFL